MKKCYVHLERLPEHMIKKSIVKVDIKCENPSEETFKADEIKIEDHNDLDDYIYTNNVSHFIICNYFSYIHK